MKTIYLSRTGPGGEPDAPGRRPVTEVMSSPVDTIDAEAPLGDALTAMIRAGRRHLVVLDPDGRCAGVLADRAVAAAWAYDHAALAAQPVRSVLDESPAVVPRGARLVDAARAMHAAHVDAVAVVDPDGRPVGIVTGSDLIARLAR